jgi:hypothetical protein
LRASLPRRQTAPMSRANARDCGANIASSKGKNL